MNSTKVYKTNYKHKHTLKYIRSVVGKHIDPKFKFMITGVYKSFVYNDKSERLVSDWDLNESEIEEIEEKVHISYTVELERDTPICVEHDLEDYIKLLECFISMRDEFKKKGLLFLPDTIEEKIDFDIIEEDSLTLLSLDNNNISEFVMDLQNGYTPFEYRQYYPHINEKKFYNIKLNSTYNSKNEHNVIENIEHFEKYLDKKCKKEGFHFVKVKTKTKNGDDGYNIYTKSQYRSMNINNVLKK